MWKPMLAGRIGDIETVKFPVLASPKIDGIRATVQGGMLLSRKLKQIPNHATFNSFSKKLLEGSDGELICGKPTDLDVFRKTSSAVMSLDGDPEVTYFIFDKYCEPDTPFKERLEEATRLAKRKNIQIVPHGLIKNMAELLEFERHCLGRGYEGVMTRDPYGPYKEGRSTLREGWLLKLKRFLDGEAEILGLDERLHNNNEATRNELGKIKRSSHKANLVPMGTLGSLLVKDLKTGIEFSVGTGMDDEFRLQIWRKPSEVLGKIIRYKYFPTGSKDRPRFPVFNGFRDADDLSIAGE
jgi:ATP-dependent DNA ligase